MSITTKRGDDGGTDLMFGKRIEKMDARIEAIGSIDELNAVLGLVLGTPFLGVALGRARSVRNHNGGQVYGPGAERLQ